MALAALTARASVIAAEAGAVAPFTAWGPVIALKAALRAVTAFKTALLALAAFTARASVVAAEAGAVVVKAALRAVTALKPAFLALATFAAWASVVTAEAGPVAPLAAWGGRRVAAGRAATGGGFGFKGGHGQL